MIKEQLVEWFPKAYVFEVEEDCTDIIHISKEWGIFSNLVFRVDNFFGIDGQYIEIMLDNHKGVNFVAFKVYSDASVA